MSLELISIGSSSSGNSYIIRSENTAILLDLGLSAKKIIGAIQSVGLTEDDIQAVLITHEHVDHVKSIRPIARACGNASFYASGGTIRGCSSFEHVPDDRLNTISAGDELELGELMIRSFALSHDANEPLGYSVECGDDRLAVVTDTGIITDEIKRELELANKLVFESNHEVDMLMMGPYPYNVKRRILSDVGHLSNMTCAEVLCEIIRRNHEYGEPAMDIMLAHLSSTNNTPFNARAVIEDELRKLGYERGVDYNMTIAAKEGLTIL